MSRSYPFTHVDSLTAELKENLIGRQIKVPSRIKSRVELSQISSSDEYYHRCIDVFSLEKQLDG